MDLELNESFVSLRRAADKLGVPATWLREEAESGTVPSLRAGRRLLFHVPSVERALLERAATYSAEAAHA